MQFFRGSQRARLVETPLRAAPIGEDVAALEHALDLLIEGKYLTVPKGDGPLSRKIKAAADAMHERGLRELRFVVDMSLNVNEAVTATAEMMRDIREVDARSQSIASASEEMVASVGEISTNSEAAARDAGEAEQFANQARTTVEEAVATMNAIAKAVETAAAKVDGLAEASSQIGDIVQQIEAIARQTNLLALNATIEAARAGDAGKGFAVVATEVKTLANQTAKATENIRSRINHLLDEMASIVTSMEQGAVAVQKGQEVITETGESMHLVADKIHGVSAKMGDIASILEQQTTASSEISSGIGGIAELSGNNVHSISGVMDVMDKADGLIATAASAVSAAELRNFTINIAKSDHAIWRKRLAQMLVGRVSLKADELADHHKCRLGKWYDSVQDPELRNHPAFKSLIEPHATVHTHGIEAARCAEKGNLDDAVKHIEHVAHASKDVLRLLDELANRKETA